MDQGHGHEANSHQLEGRACNMQRYAGHSAHRGLVVKDVREGTPDNLKRFFVAVNREGGSLPNIERADVVKAQYMVGMAVREQNGVKPVEARAERLLAKVRGGV